MLDRFRQRSYELENIDKGTYTPEEYEGSLIELRRVNRFLGDASALRSSLLHQFDDEGAIRILREMSRVARRDIFVIDLHRHPLAYFLYSTLGHIILHNRLLREDGALSILRSFKPKELRQLARQAGLQESQV